MTKRFDWYIRLHGSGGDSSSRSAILKKSSQVPQENSLKYEMKPFGKSLLRLPGIAASVLIGISSCASAQSQTYFTEYVKNITRLGAQSTGWYVGFAESLGQNCLYNNLYVLPERKALYVQLLSAKLSGRAISRIDYSRSGAAGTQCYVELVEFAE